MLEKLNAYVPMDRRQALSKGEALPDRTRGAALLADISGFTPLTHALAEELGRKAGAEEVLRQINPVYQALIVELHRYGGSVISFAGDAITCWLDQAQGPAVPRAVACALAMQAAMEPFRHVGTPAGTTIRLGVKVAVAAGPARRFLVGDPDIHLVEILAGQTLERMATAEERATIGEVVVSREVVDELGSGLLAAGWRGEGESFALVTGMVEPVEPTPWPDIPVGARQDRARPWVLPPVYACLQAGEAFPGDLRPVTPLFLRFGGLDYDQDDQAGDKLDAFVRWVQAVVHRYLGNLIQLTIGDKGSYLYAVFGAPSAHEDDTRRALAAALELQHPPPEWTWLGPVQIGISRGEVWTGECGAAMRHTYSVMGNEVNLSARLMMQAPPGQILVSGGVGKHPAFRFAPGDAIACKGFARPVPVYRLLGEKAVEDRFFPQRMVGRQAELQQLADWAQPLFAGQFAGAALIYGEAGVGKSHLVYTLGQALGNSVTWFTAQADALLRQPLNPFVYWLRGYFEQSAEAEAGQNRDRFEQRLEQLLQDLAGRGMTPRTQDLAQELVRARSILGALLGLHWPDSLYERLDAKGRHENTLFVLKTLLLAESCLRPVVLELEDGHWLDEASQELLAVLTRNVAAYPLLLVITSRHADDGSRPAFALASATPTTLIDLEVLSMDALREQAEAILGGPVDDALLALLEGKTQANPFFAQQVLYYFQANDLLAQRPDGTWTVRATTFDIPSSIQAILIARIDRLTQRVKEVVQAAAVLGREFEVRVLSQMLRGNVAWEVQQAEQGQIWTALHELRYLFKHALLRDAAYEMQLRARLRQLHQMAAKAYERLYAADLSEHYSNLAYHYQRAGDEHKERDYAWLAGQRAATQFANTEAVRFFSRALTLTPEDGNFKHLTERYNLLLAREGVLDLQGLREAQQQDLVALEAIAEALDEDRRWAEVALRRAHYAEVTGDFPGSIAAAQMATKLAQVDQDPGIEAVGHLEWGRALWRQGDYPAARVQLDRALALAQDAGLPQVTADSLRNLGIICWYLGDFPGARTYFERAMPIYHEIGFRHGESLTLNNLGLVAVGQGDYVGAKACFEQVLRIDRETGNRYGEGLTLGNLGTVVFEWGDYASARAHLEQALQLCRTIGNRATEAVIMGGLCLTFLREGDKKTAQEYAQEVLSVGKELGDRLAQGYAWTYLGHVLVEMEQWDEALDAYQQSLEIRRALGQHSLALDSLAGLARVWLARGDLAQAQTYVEAILEITESSSQTGVEDRLLVYLTCYRVLKDNQDLRAQGILSAAYRLLEERSAYFPDEETRRSFLENVAVHREIVALWAAQQGDHAGRIETGA